MPKEYSIGMVKPVMFHPKTPRKRRQPAGEILTRADMIAELRMLIAGRTMRRCGLEWGVDFHEISAVLHEDQYPGEELLAVLGLREESDVMYVRVATAAAKGKNR